MENLEIRKTLVVERLSEIGKEISDEQLFSVNLKRYFTENAERLGLLFAICDRCEDANRQADVSMDMQALTAENQALYEPLLPKVYDESFFNPAYAVQCFGEDMGQLFSFLQTELASVISAAFFGELFELVIRAELFLEVYAACKAALLEDKKLPAAETLKETIYWFVSDYSDEENERRVRALVDPDCAESRRFYEIIMHAQLDDLRYLYSYGCYITENELRTARYLNSLPQEKIDLMADTFSEGYRIGFQVGGKDLSRKQTVNIRYCAGFERVIRKAVLNFEKMGLKPVIYRASESIFHKSGVSRIGFYGAIPNKQLDYDHREDDALVLDGNYKTRKLETLKEAYEQVKELALGHAGPACMEVFGETPFTPVECPQALKLTESGRKFKVEYRQASGDLVNRYIPGEERSFTIIAFPVPEIGEDFEAVFDEIIRINTLDYQLYAGIQQKLIDALDQADEVKILGTNGNHTDLTVRLHPLSDPAKQTKFENCVADVNIPVGEVFTSPVLEGTNGVLHVKQVYLNDLLYRDLEVHLKDGMTTEVTCKNFADEEENRRYMKENVLFHHPSLPVGEFAIGTNTTAYVAAGKFHIEDKLPILIAEKMGPHFALGDTCYSHAEEVAVFNPDGKEIIAKDNAVSLLRKTDVSRAYYNCHTDITIPYDELLSIEAVRPDGSVIPIIKNGRFVLPGCEKLNEPFESVSD